VRRLALPEVTFCVNSIASARRGPQHGHMSIAPRQLLQPLNLAGLCTLFAVGLSLRWVPPQHAFMAWTLLLGFVLCFVGHDLLPRSWVWRRHAVLVLQPLLALVLIWLTPRIGTAQVLVVIWIAVVAMAWSPRSTLAAVVLVDVAIYLILRTAGHDNPLIITLLYAGFQGFAALTAHYAMSAERARDALARVNADLLATRALLADSARDAERLRVARELHDVAGHKLTALTLNLRALAADPAYAGRHELAVAQQMSAELLGDIRSVVQALRDSRGLDLGTALRALAAPMPKPTLVLSIGNEVQVGDPAIAEAVLRLVQEALTNSARHAEAEVVRVSLRRDGDRLAVAVEDDGHVRGTIREGNGLAGMRERLAAAGGTLALSTTSRGALRIDASLPL
jgi:signal transduction histidine kinase